MGSQATPAAPAMVGCRTQCRGAFFDVAALPSAPHAFRRHAQRGQACDGQVRSLANIYMSDRVLHEKMYTYYFSHVLSLMLQTFTTSLAFASCPLAMQGLA